MWPAPLRRRVAWWSLMQVAAQQRLVGTMVKLLLRAAAMLLALVRPLEQLEASLAASQAKAQPLQAPWLPVLERSPGPRMLSEQRQPPPQPHEIVSYLHFPKALAPKALAPKALAAPESARIVDNPDRFESNLVPRRLPTQAGVNPTSNGIFS